MCFERERDGAVIFILAIPRQHDYVIARLLVNMDVRLCCVLVFVSLWACGATNLKSTHTNNWAVLVWQSTWDHSNSAYMCIYIYIRCALHATGSTIAMLPTPYPSIVV